MSKAKPEEGKMYNQLFLNLKADDPKEEYIYNFLLSVGNKRSKLIVHAVEEFINKYNLDGSSKGMVQYFLKEYSSDEVTDVPKSKKTDKTVVKKEAEPKIEKKTEFDEILDSSIKDKAKAQLSMFGIT